MRPPGFIPILLFFTTGIISIVQIHLYLALFLRRDDFFCSDSSPACSFSPQGLFLPPGFIPSLLFGAAGMISSAQMHLYLALFLHRDYFGRPDSSLSCSFLPLGLFPPPGFISILLFSSAGIISAARIHLYLVLPCCRDYFFRPDSSPACSFSPQGLFRPPGFIPSLLFGAAGITSSARIHPQLAFLCRRDDFCCPDSSLSCSFSPQGLLRPPGFIPSLLFCAAGMISSAQMHPQLAFFTTGIISTVQIHLYLAFFSAGIISDCDDPP